MTTLITGVTSQDVSDLVERLTKRGCSETRRRLFQNDVASAAGERPGQFRDCSHLDWPTDEFFAEAFSLVGLEGRRHVRIDLCYLRPAEFGCTRGYVPKVPRMSGWGPKANTKEPVRLMIECDVGLAVPEAHNARLPVEDTV